MENIYVEGSIFWERFRDPAQYLQARRHVEAWLRTSFAAKGSRPKAPCPIYMIFGRSKWIETMLAPTNLAATLEIEMPLSLFGESVVSFTYPDSMISYMLDRERDAHYYLPDYHGQVFTLSEIRAIVEEYGLPGH